MKTRNEKALQRVGCGRETIASAIWKSNTLAKEIRDRQSEKKALDAMLTFHESPHKIDYVESRVWQIVDGETHYVVASSESEAIEIHAKQMEYASVEAYREDVGDVAVREMPPDIAISVTDESTGDIVVRSCAEWAEVETGVFCSSIW